jgi:hypothetical protein
MESHGPRGGAEFTSAEPRGSLRGATEAPTSHEPRRGAEFTSAERRGSLRGATEAPLN